MKILLVQVMLDYGIANDAYNTKLYTVNVSYIIPGSNIFINHPTYNVKWLPLFDLIDEFMQSRETTRFWASPYTGRIDWVNILIIQCLLLLN